MNVPAHTRCRCERGAGYMLLEIMLAVAIFTVGVLALGRCLVNCLDTQAIIAQEEHARLALQNAMAEVQANPALPDEQNTQSLDGMFKGITMIEQRKTLDLKNQKNQGMPGLHQITLTANWRSPNGAVQNRSVSFTLLRGNG